MNELIVMTGAAGGIGSHLVRELSRLNYRIIATDYDLAALKDVAEQQGWPSDVILEVLDVRDENRWSELFETIESRYGRVDVMMNVAGVLKPGTFIDEDIESYERHFEVNVRGVFLERERQVNGWLHAGKDILSTSRHSRALHRFLAWQFTVHQNMQFVGCR